MTKFAKILQTDVGQFLVQRYYDAGTDEERIECTFYKNGLRYVNTASYETTEQADDVFNKFSMAQAYLVIESSFADLLELTPGEQRNRRKTKAEKAKRGNS